MSYNDRGEPQYVTFSNIIKAEDLLTRWSGCPENDLAYHARNNVLPCYLYSRTLKKPNGEFVHYCSQSSGPYDSGNGEDCFWEWDVIVFNVEDVEEFEKTHPEYLWEPVSIERAEVSSKKNKDKPGNNIVLTADDICKRWSLSPAQLVGIVQSNADLPVYWEEDNVPF